MILDYQRFVLALGEMKLNVPTNDAILHSLNEYCSAEKIEEVERKKGITKEEFISLIKAIPTGNDDSKVDYYYDAIDKIDDAYLRGYLNAKTEALNKSLSSDSQDYKDEFLAIVNGMCFL